MEKYRKLNRWFFLSVSGSYRSGASRTSPDRASVDTTQRAVPNAPLTRAMSTETPHAPSSQHRQRHDRREDIRYVASRVEQWLSDSPNAESPANPEALDTNQRRWDVLNPSATRIGRAEDPENDVDGRLRALHAERRAAMQGNPERARKLDVARITQAVCNSLDLTAWERDRVLGVVCELDPAAFGTGRTVPRVAVVVARRVVDAERRAWLGLADDEWAERQPPEQLADRRERLHRLTESEEYERQLSACDLTADAVDRLDALLNRELDGEQLRKAVVGRSPHRDPHLPPTSSY